MAVVRPVAEAWLASVSTGTSSRGKVSACERKSVDFASGGLRPRPRRLYLAWSLPARSIWGAELPLKIIIDDSAFLSD